VDLFGCVFFSLAFSREVYVPVTALSGVLVEAWDGMGWREGVWYYLLWRDVNLVLSCVLCFVLEWDGMGKGWTCMVKKSKGGCRQVSYNDITSS